MAVLEETRVPAMVYPDVPWQRRSLAAAVGLFGPGAIIASVTVASGETLFASRAGAIFGYTLLWFILFCTLCKLVQVYTAARYMILTGEHPMEAWARLPGPRGWFPAFLGGLSVICFPFWLGGLALILGTAVNWMVGLDAGPEAAQRLSSQLFGTAALVLASIITLRQTYRFLERAQTIIVGLLLLAILAAMVLAPVDWDEALLGSVVATVPDYDDWMRASYPDIVSQQTVVLALAVFMAAIGGGTYDYIGYLSFFREKRWGALHSKEIPRADPVGHEPPPVDAGPPVIDTSGRNLGLGRQWLRAPMIDVFAGFTCVCIFTIAFNILGAAILHPQQIVPDKFALLTPQAEFLTRFGAPFKYLYQAGIFMAFWGTIYGALEIYSRTAYECFRPLVPRVRRSPYERFRLPVCVYACTGAALLMWLVQDPIRIVEPAALIGATTCGIWCFAMIWADRRMLPAGLQMNSVWVACNVLAGVAMAGFGVTAIVHYLR